MARTKKPKAPTMETLETETDLKPVSTWHDRPKLTERQLRLLEVTERDVLNSKLGMAIEEQTLKNLTLQQSYLDLAIEKQKLILTAKSSEYENLKNRYATISKDVFTQHGLAGDRLSYDSETGDIIE